VLIGHPGHNRGQTLPAEPLTAEEVRALFQATNRGDTGTRNRALLALLYGTGLRLGEALALRPADADLSSGTVRVLHGKGNKARTVGLDPGTAAHVQAWVDARRRLGHRNGKLFCRLDGGPWSPQAVREMLRRAREKAGLEKRVYPHGLRHTHAAELVAEGVPMDIIRDQLGHTSLAVTDRYLHHVAPRRVVDAMRVRTPRGLA
jgi:site-specific recombinase XerD